MRVDQNPIDYFLGAAMFGLVFMVVYLAFNAVKEARHTSVRKALLEKFSSAPDLGAFLQTSSGQRFMAELSTGAGNPLQSVLSSIQKGILFMFIGSGFFPLSMGFKENSPVVTGVGIVLILAGAGFLVSAVITYLLSKWWGMLSGDSKASEK
jgi:hypothetical protein